MLGFCIPRNAAMIAANLPGREPCLSTPPLRAELPPAGPERPAGYPVVAHGTGPSPGMPSTIWSRVGSSCRFGPASTYVREAGLSGKESSAPFKRMGDSFVVGGTSALELHGRAHYLPPVPPAHDTPVRLRTLARLGPICSVLRKTFRRHGTAWLSEPEELSERCETAAPCRPSRLTFPGGDGFQTVRISTLERALFEILKDVPAGISFEYAEQLMEGLVDLSPRRLDALLRRTRNVKVKRLFLLAGGAAEARLEQTTERPATSIWGRGKRVPGEGRPVGTPLRDHRAEIDAWIAATRFYRQAALVVRVLSHVARREEFALKGGSAINLFLRDLPRLSVDIDLTYLPLTPREEALPAIRQGLDAVGTDLRATIPGIGVQATDPSVTDALAADSVSGRLSHQDRGLSGRAWHGVAHRDAGGCRDS